MRQHTDRKLVGSLFFTIAFCLITTLTGTASASEVKCDFISLTCKKDRTCGEYKPKKVYLYGGDVDHLLDLYIRGLVEAGILEKHISKNLEVSYFENDAQLKTIKVPSVKAAFEDRKKLLDYIRTKAEGKKASAYNLTDEKVKNLSKNADIFACVPASPSPSPMKTHKEKTDKDIQQSNPITYDLQKAHTNPFRPQAPHGKKDEFKAWVVNSPEAPVYIDIELPEHFRATLNITPQQEGIIVAGFSKRESEKPNYRVVMNNHGSTLKKQGDVDSDLRISDYKPVAGQKFILDLSRDHGLVTIKTNGTQILHGDVDNDHMLTMKRLFVAGTFILHDLKIQEIKNK